MTFEWDEAKNEVNIRKHHIDFADACSILDTPVCVKCDTKRICGEDR